MKSNPHPPRLAVVLLTLFLPDGAPRDGALGDLEEEFAARAVGAPHRAAIWYWREALSVASHYAVERLRQVAFALGSTRRTSRIETWLLDLKYAGRRMRRNGGFTAIVVTTVAVAIAANAAIFGAVRPVLAPDLPFPEVDQVMRIWEANPERGWTRSSASWHNARDWREESTSFQAMAAYTVWEGNLGTDDGAQRIRYALTEPDFFRVLAVQPQLGRVLASDEIEPDRGDVIVLGHALWVQSFGSDPDIVGKRVTLSELPLTVVGVMPPAFQYPAATVDAWKPFGMTPDQGGQRGSHWVSVIGRLNPEADIQQAQAELNAIGKGLEDQFPDSNQGFRPLLEPVTEVAVLGARRGVMMLWAAVGLLLLVACVNITTLLLARSEDRLQEMGVRKALGAARPAIVRQLFVENFLLAVLGGLSGILLALPATSWVARLMDARLAYGLQVQLNAPVVAYGVLVTVIAGVAFGLLPAFRDSPAASSSGAAGRSVKRANGKLGSVLVSTQIAVAVVILVGAGLLGRTLAGLRSVDPGYPIERVMTLRVAPAWELDREAASIVLEEIRAGLATLPGVQAVSAVNRLPLSGNMWGSEWTSRAKIGEAPLRANARVVLPGYHEAIGIPLLAGRSLQELDSGTSEPVAVLSQTAALRYWDGADPIGSYISLNPDRAEGTWHRVVGVVEDVEETGLGNGPGSIVYTTLTQSRFGHFGDWGMDFVVRTNATATQLMAPARETVAGIDSALPIFDVETMESRLSAAIAGPRALALLMAIFAATALFLASIGVYGTLAFEVSRRRAEIGVRRALGAQAGEVIGFVFRRGMTLVVAGLVAGLTLAALGSRWVESLLFDVEGSDPITYGAIAITLALVGMIASGVPAWRAARVDPVEALRQE